MFSSGVLGPWYPESARCLRTPVPPRARGRRYRRSSRHGRRADTVQHVDVLLLGTGSADGWPNAFCRCASCRWAARTGDLRSPTSALIDDRLLIDCGPEAPRQALRAATDLAAVTSVLITHVHSDHLDPAFLLYRGWAQDRPLNVFGPTPVVRACEPWLDPQQTAVRLIAVTAGDEFEVDGYQVLVVPARHEALGEAVLFRVSDGTHSLLYASDTGPWELNALELLASTPLDLVLLEETFGERENLGGGHHHLGSFGMAVDALWNHGCLTTSSRVVAVHLSHHNPPDIGRRLERLGVELWPDGTLLRLGKNSTS